MFANVERKYVEEFIRLYSEFIQNPKSKLIKKKAEGLGIRTQPQFSKAIISAAQGSYKIELGEMTLDEAKKILKELKKVVIILQ